MKVVELKNISNKKIFSFILGTHWCLLFFLENYFNLTI